MQLNERASHVPNGIDILHAIADASGASGENHDSALPWSRIRARAMRNLRLVSGGTYIALGVTAALAGDRPARG